ncbi:unnamed protein product, partial [marine sediment metagenome]
MLSKTKIGNNYALPDETKHILSLVASPFPEYIDTKNDFYFLSQNIPRVCTPREIIELINEFKITDYEFKP